MLESVSLQKNRIRSAKNVIFFTVHFGWQTNGGGFEPPNPPLRTPLNDCVRTVSKVPFKKAALPLPFWRSGTPV